MFFSRLLLFLKDVKYVYIYITKTFPLYVAHTYLSVLGGESMSENEKKTDVSSLRCFHTYWQKSTNRRGMGYRFFLFLVWYSSSIFDLLGSRLIIL